jgi:hypothetical protein
MHCNPKNKAILNIVSIKLALTVLLLKLFLVAFAQPVTGVWRGRMVQGTGFKQRSAPLEVKLIAQGDSIVGTAYYYGVGKNYIRYSLKGYFGQEYNTVYWQDYYMIDMYPKKAPEAREFDELLKASADFSCPDGITMKLDGFARLPGVPEFKLELKKMGNSLFPDEWDDVISGYFMGMARAEVVDSVWQISSEPLIAKTTISKKADKEGIAKNVKPNTAISNDRPVETIPITPMTAPAGDSQSVAKEMVTEKPTPAPVAKPTPRPTAPVDITAEIAKTNAQNRQTTTPANPQTTAPQPQPKAEIPIANPAPVTPPVAVAVMPPQPLPEAVMEEAFKERRKVVQSEIAIGGDTLELRFYDNADVDGDSISLFLNGVPMFQHVRLDVKPYIFKIPLENLPEISELAMVAENLGAIPPNTAFMEAFVLGKRYTARLESTEETTAVIRLVRRE